MPPGCIRWAASSAMPGGNGTADSATMFATSSAANRAHCGAWRTGWSAAPRFTLTSSARRSRAVNFVTCHDGFTLNDLVSYNQKHNEANGEDNRDGANDNRSWNCGVEGPTDDPTVEKLRDRQVKNFLTRHADVAGHAHDLDGRRSQAHAARQQQRLLSRQ